MKTARVDTAGGFDISKALVDPSGELTYAEAMGRAGDIPVAVKPKVSRGWAALLNLSADSFPRLDSPETTKGTAAFVRSWMPPSPLDLKPVYSPILRLSPLGSDNWKQIVVVERSD